MSLHEERRRRRVHRPCGSGRRDCAAGDGLGMAMPGGVDRLCDAAGAVFYAIIHFQAEREGRMATVPTLLCPVGRPPCPCSFSREELLEAEAFLRRMGFVTRRAESDMPEVDI